jgi:hypothetical protein
MNRLQGLGVNFMLETQVVHVHRGKNSVKVGIQSVKNANTLHEDEIGGDIREQEFDEIIFACDADTALTILGKQATSLERQILSKVKVREPCANVAVVPDPHPISTCTTSQSPIMTKSIWKRYVGRLPLSGILKDIYSIIDWSLPKNSFPPSEMTTPKRLRARISQKRTLHRCTLFGATRLTRRRLR